jgi:hypothetical protein
VVLLRIVSRSEDRVNNGMTGSSRISSLSRGRAGVAFIQYIERDVIGNPAALGKLTF